MCGMCYNLWMGSVTTCGSGVLQFVGGCVEAKSHNLWVGCVEGKSHNLWVGCVTTCGWGALQLVDEECAYAVCSSPRWQLSKSLVDDEVWVYNNTPVFTLAEVVG